MTSAKPRPVSVVITRSQEGNEELATRLRLMGLEPITVNTISIVPPRDWGDVDRALGNLGSYGWVVFTSTSGAEYFGRRMEALSLKLPRKGRPRVAAVGKQTAEALSRLGAVVDFVPSSYTTATLGEELPARKGERVLLLRSDLADPRLKDRLTERGFSVEEEAIYRTLPVGGPSPKIRRADIIVFASPSAVRSFCALAAEEELQRLRMLRAVCIGPVTESAARERGFVKTSRPGSFTIDAVVDEIARLGRADG